MEIGSIVNSVSNGLAAQQAQKVQQAQEARQPLQEKPVEAASGSQFYQAPDEYSPKEPEPASGLYWVEPSEDGPKVNYSAPEDEPEQETSDVTTMNTDEVDREIERLRQKVEELESQAAQAEKSGDSQKSERLERELKQAQTELQQKDNDTYRRTHAKIS